MRKDAVEAHARWELARQGGEVSNARRARSAWGSGRRLSLGALTWSHVTHFVLMTHYKSDRTDSYGYISNVDCFFCFAANGETRKGCCQYQ